MKEGSKGGFNMQIGERIRCLRISKGLTQYDLAQAIHISSSFMNQMCIRDSAYPVLGIKKWA